MNYKTISSKNIVETVFSRYRNYLSQDSDGFLGNVIEWIGEALDAIGILTATNNEHFCLEVCNGRIEFPCNLYLINSVTYNGCYLSYGGKFNYDIHCDKCPNETTCYTEHSYIVNSNWLQTNVSDGENIHINCQVFAVDKDGFPLVPDNISVKQALFWYITMMLCLGGFQHPEINFEKAEARWLKYCLQAEVSVNSMDAPRREAFKAGWLRLGIQTEIALQSLRYDTGIRVDNYYGDF